MTETAPGSKPEIDDSQNPTSASPETTATFDTMSGSEAAYESDPTTSERAGQAGAQGAQMLNQLQSMIDNLSQQAAPVVRQATPVLRQVAAKAAELAAIAAERAGPLAQRAADVTQDVGVRVAARSREVASDLRASEQRKESASGSASGAYPDAPGAGPAGPSRPTEGTERPPTTTGL
jgi:hypothetical protein